MQTLISILEVLLMMVPVLMVVAFTTVAERKSMASMQRRVGPNAVGLYGTLQAFADALKLLLKEYVAPTQSNKVIFFIGPVVTLIFSLLGYAVVPFAPSLVMGDIDLGILFALAVSAIATYGILLAGWSANSKYAFLGSLRSTAQLISYELILGSAIILVLVFTSALNMTDNIESQRNVYLIIPLFPAFVMFYIAAIAETNRAPFDLAEAESELVSGYMTEHSSVVFVFFFLAEYASIILISILTIILFLGGYLVMDYIDNYGLNGLVYALSLGLKGCFVIFLFIWIRASFPRVRYDQLMSYCWVALLPIAIAIIVLTPILSHSLDLFVGVLADTSELPNSTRRMSYYRVRIVEFFRFHSNPDSTGGFRNRPYVTPTGLGEISSHSRTATAVLPDGNIAARTQTTYSYAERFPWDSLPSTTVVAYSPNHPESFVPETTITYDLALFNVRPRVSNIVVPRFPR